MNQVDNCVVLLNHYIIINNYIVYEQTHTGNYKNNDGSKSGPLVDINDEMINKQQMLMMRRMKNSLDGTTFFGKAASSWLTGLRYVSTMNDVQPKFSCKNPEQHAQCSLWAAGPVVWT